MWNNGKIVFCFFGASLEINWMHMYREAFPPIYRVYHMHMSYTDISGGSGLK